MLPSKSHLMLIGIGAVAGYFLANQLINTDFNGQAAGNGFNPFAKAYGYGYSFATGATFAG